MTGQKACSTRCTRSQPVQRGLLGGRPPHCGNQRPVSWLLQTGFIDAFSIELRGIDHAGNNEICMRYTTVRIHASAAEPQDV
jgi:hypothetical protein